MASAMQLEFVEKIDSLFDELLNSEATNIRLENLLKTIGVPFLQTVAAEALLYFYKGPRSKTNSTRYQNLAAEGDERLQMIAEVVGVSAWKYAKVADSIVDKRNHMACHYSNWEKLDQKIHHCREILLCLPKLKQDCQLEAQVIELYENLKKAFGICH